MNNPTEETKLLPLDIDVTVADGKYRVIAETQMKNFRALRYGEEWRSLTGDNLIMYLASELQELRKACTPPPPQPVSNEPALTQHQWASQMIAIGAEKQGIKKAPLSPAGIKLSEALTPKPSIFETNAGAGWTDASLPQPSETDIACAKTRAEANKWTPEYRAELLAKGMTIINSQPSETKSAEELLTWAVERWNAEVKERPITNIYHRILDETWRQVIRHAGGSPDELIGKSTYKL